MFGFFQFKSCVYMTTYQDKRPFRTCNCDELTRKRTKEKINLYKLWDTRICSTPLKGGHKIQDEPPTRQKEDKHNIDELANKTATKHRET